MGSAELVDACRRKRKPACRKRKPACRKRKPACRKRKRACPRRKPAVSKAFLNFLAEFKQKNCGMSACEVFKKACSAWKALTRKQKAKYRCPAPRSPCCPRRKKRKSCCPKPRRRCPRRRKKRSCKPRRKCPRRKRKCPRRRKPKCKKRYACECPGPLTNNGFLNFLREFRKNNCGLSPKQIAIQGARCWCKLSKCEKQRYKDMGKRAPKKCKRRRRRPRCC